MTEKRRLRLRRLVIAAVQLAIIRHDLTVDGNNPIDKHDRNRIATDIWDAMNGAGTCNETVLPELAALLEET